MSKPLREDPDGHRRASVRALCVLVVGALLALESFGVGFLAEDTTILAYVAGATPGADAFGAQYDLHTLLFWRPLVTLSWDLEAWAFGPWAPGLRLSNWIAHVLCALLVARVVRQLGGGEGASLVAALFVVTFPFQGGTVTWIAGRSDGWVAPWMVLCVSLALDRRVVASAVVAFVACATKEMAFVLPAWLFVFGLAAGRRWRELLTELLPATVAVLLAFVLRRALLGVWIGGYPAPAAPVDDASLLPLAELWSAVRTWGRTQGALTLGLIAWPLVALCVGALPAGAPRRLVLAGWAAALVGALPLFDLLRDGIFEDASLRTLRVSDLGLGCAFAGCAAALWSRSPGPARSLASAWRAIGVVLLFCALGWRGLEAWRDQDEWAASARTATAWEARARARAGASDPATVPLLALELPATRGGAFCLNWGVADRFRAPFEPAPRDVWPWRPVFDVGAPRARTPAFLVDDDFADPASPALWPELDVRVRAAPPAKRRLEFWTLDQGLVDPLDTTERLEVHDAPPGTRLELLLVTPIGYEAYPFDPGPDGSISLAETIWLTNGLTFADAWYLAADVRSDRAYVEVRAVDVGTGQVVAVGDWVELRWEQGVLDRLPDPYAAQRR